MSFAFSQWQALYLLLIPWCGMYQTHDSTLFGDDRYSCPAELRPQPSAAGQCCGNENAASLYITRACRCFKCTARVCVRSASSLISEMLLAGIRVACRVVGSEANTEADLLPTTRGSKAAPSLPGMLAVQTLRKRRSREEFPYHAVERSFHVACFPVPDLGTCRSLSPSGSGMTPSLSTYS